MKNGYDVGVNGSHGHIGNEHRIDKVWPCIAMHGHAKVEEMGYAVSNE